MPKQPLLRLLLVQVRRPTDPMAPHEQECILRKLQGCGVELVVRNAFGENPEPSWLVGADGLIVGGSGSFGVVDAPSQQWLSGFRALFQAALLQDLPSFAICFGHQLLGHHLGADVLNTAEHAEVGTVELQLSAQGAADPVFGELPSRFLAQTGHSDHVSHTPVGVDVLASNAACHTQAFRVRGTRFYSTQFHPDLTAQEARDRYLAYYGGNMPEAARKKAERFELAPDHAQSLLSWFVQQAIRPQLCDMSAVHDGSLPQSLGTRIRSKSVAHSFRDGRFPGGALWTANPS